MLGRLLVRLPGVERSSAALGPVSLGDDLVLREEVDNRLALSFDVRKQRGLHAAEIVNTAAAYHFDTVQHKNNPATYNGFGVQN